jgi:hypothetical protein
MLLKGMIAQCFRHALAKSESSASCFPKLLPIAIARLLMEIRDQAVVPRYFPRKLWLP